MTKTPRYLVALGLATVGVSVVVATGAPAPAATEPRSVAAFYYPWYGTPKRDGAWLHWRGDVGTPAFQSGFVPALGAYSSADPSVLATHMSELRDAGVDTVIVSWWGTGSIEDRRLPAVERAARVHGLHVAVHVEPYPGRTPETVAGDVRRLARGGVRDFYVYDSGLSTDADWASANAGLVGVRMFANTPLAGKAKAGGFAGLYTYDVLVYDGHAFRLMCNEAHAVGLICAPSVGPGFDARRATGDMRVRPRRNGATYDHMWRAAIRARPEIVTITSFNEWHEGTQIEPAREAGAGVQSYDGAWGAVGKSAARAYLDRTALWASRYRGDLPITLTR